MRGGDGVPWDCTIFEEGHSGRDEVARGIVLDDPVREGLLLAIIKLAVNSSSSRHY